MGGSFFYMKRTGRPLGGVGRVMAGAKRCAWSEANLLPVTKFVSKGVLIKCLGQVDLVTAPRNTVHRQSPPPPVSAMLPLGLAVEQKKM